MSWNSLGSLIPKNLRRVGVAKSVEAAVIVSLAQKQITVVCGSEVGERSRVLFVRNKALYIASLDASTSQEIKLRQPDVLHAINTVLKSDAIRTIIFVS